MIENKGLEKKPVHITGMFKVGSHNDPDQESWKARICDNPLVEAFPESIHTHPGIGLSPVLEKDKSAVVDRLISKPRELRTVAYLNVPFCETRCLYCLFYIKPYRNAEESKYFADTLIKELQLWSNKPVQNHKPVHAVYFGGGTPTALEAKDIGRIVKAVRQYLPLANDCEITLEGRLSNFGNDKIEEALNAGVNRFSLGVQSFNTKIRQAVGRISTKQQLIDQLSLLKSYDQAAVVVDLIYGFPYQTMQTWEKDIEICQALELDGADCYQLRVFPKSPLYKYIQNGKLPNGPDHSLRAKMFDKSMELMEKANWHRLSISHWAGTTRERNFYNYFAKSRSDCLAFGPGAGGTLHGYSYMQMRDVNDWSQSVERGEKPIAMLMEPSKHWYLNRAIAEHLELNYLNPLKLSSEFTFSFEDLWEPLLSNWTQAGLMTQRGSFFNLTRAGQFWQTRLTQHLLDYTQKLNLL